MTLPFARAVYCAAAVAALAIGIAVHADEPGPLATPTDKLDYLLRSWRGRTLDELKKVWGKEAELEHRNGRDVYVFMRRVKVRASIVGVSVYAGEGLRCVARFEIDEEHKVSRTARQGGGQDCWNAFRRNDPP